MCAEVGRIFEQDQQFPGTDVGGTKRKDRTMSKEENKERETDSQCQTQTAQLMDSSYGLCPVCKQPGFFRDTGDGQWICCDRDKLKWQHEYVMWGGQWGCQRKPELASDIQTCRRTILAFHGLVMPTVHITPRLPTRLVALAVNLTMAISNATD